MLDSISPDGKSLEFTTVRIENIAPGWRAKEAYRIVSADEFVETFSLSPPGKEFAVYSENASEAREMNPAVAPRSPEQVRVHVLYKRAEIPANTGVLAIAVSVTCRKLEKAENPGSIPVSATNSF